MGTTMQTHIEVKKDNTWHHFGAPNITRNYCVFAAISGERKDCVPNGGRIRPVAKSYAMPSDATLVTTVSYEQDKSSGVHGICVLTAEDLPVLQDRLYEYCPEVERTGIDELDLEVGIFKHYINGNTLGQHQGWDDLRIICWFCN